MYCKIDLVVFLSLGKVPSLGIYLCLCLLWYYVFVVTEINLLSYVKRLLASLDAFYSFRLLYKLYRLLQTCSEGVKLLFDQPFSSLSMFLCIP